MKLTRETFRIRFNMIPALVLLAGIVVLGGMPCRAWAGEEEDLDALALETSGGAERLSVHGYADLQYGGDSREHGGSFIQNELSVFVRATTKDERWTAFSEIEFDRIDGKVYLTDRGGKSIEVEMETGWVEFRDSDRFRLRGGKLLLPQYWQSNHYPNLTMSTLAPLMSGNVFPKSIVALQASGDWWNSSGRGVGYALFAGGGANTALMELEQNDNMAAGGRLTFRLAGREGPAWLDTLDFSISALASENDLDQGELIVGLDSQIRVGRLEILAEFARSSLPRVDSSLRSRLDEEAGDTVGAYVQAAYRIAEKWHGFYRYDYLDFNDGLPTLRDETRHTIGANFRPRPNVSLKVELFHSEPEKPRDAYDGVAASVVFNF